LSSGSSWGTGSLSLDVSDANLETGLTFMRQALTQPEFPGGMIDRLKRQAGDRNAGDASGSDGRQPPDLDRLLDAGSPYLARARPQGDDPQQRITRDGVVAAYHRWLRPEHAVMTLVSDKPLAALLPMLNRTIGEWRAAGEAKPVPPVSYTPQPGKPEIVLIDRPGAVQASIVGGQRVAATDRGPSEALSIANTVLAGNAISRLNMNLREDKHWTYGASGAFQLRPYSSTYTVSMDVQQDKVGAAIGEVVKEMRDVLTDRPITAAELADAKRTWLGLSARLYTTGGDLAGSLEDVLRKGRSDDYANSFGDRVRAVTPAAANAALAGQLDPAKWIWVITGNAALIRPQLDRLGLPVRVVTRDRAGRSPEAAAARNTTAGTPPR
ncbi:MAG TPA: insulinase family protein, partial [Sphingomonas sp.]|nr:insulinase family protein [Sphingomonas sp.]